MPVTEQENGQYQQFVSDIAIGLDVFNYNPDEIVFHYTDGNGLLGILQSGSIYATQVAALNDKSETKYARDIFQTSISKLREKQTDEISRIFLVDVLEYLREDPQIEDRGMSMFFVTCFSAEPDDWAQWRCYGGGNGNPNGYAIGFLAVALNRAPTSQLYKVQYDRVAIEKASDTLAEATLKHFVDGLTDQRKGDVRQWGKEFFTAWNFWIYKLAPLAKHSTWQSEKEFRLVHELNEQEGKHVKFIQKESMLARRLPLTFPATPGKLPIAKIIVGPGNHGAFTTVSVRLLLDQLGYPRIPIERSQIPFQKT